MGKPGERRHKRFAVKDMHVGAKTIVETKARLSDISMGGACLESKKSLKIGAKQLVKIEDEKIRLTLLSTVVWVKLSESERNSQGEIIPVYKAGIAFIDVPPDKLLKLKDFMRTSGTPDEKKVSDHFSPSYLRFKVRENKETVIYQTNTLLVKKLSLGGMLAEVSECIEVGKKFPMALVLSHAGTPVRFKARIVTCTEIPDENISRYDVGIEFLDMSDSDKKRLGKFLSNLPENESVVV